jgi:glycosyltransferase involved in cell wall biosynthesis
VIAPLVSILIPVYNRDLLISECINSALDQTYSNIELIIVDNASTDGTLEICRQFAAVDERIKVFSNAYNIGPVLNWKRCIEEATGEFSKILFSDDLLKPDCVEKMVRVMCDPHCGFVFSAAKIGMSQDESKLSYDLKSDKFIRKENFVRLVCLGLAPLSPGAILFRTRDAYKNLHTSFPSSTFRDYSKHGAGPDVMISLLTAHAYDYVAYIREPLVFFRAHKNSISVSDSNNEVLNSYDSAISFYLKSNNYWFYWIFYLTESWFRRGRMNLGWNNPKSFVQINEGNGSFYEILAFALYGIFFMVPLKVFNKLLK